MKNNKLAIFVLLVAGFLSSCKDELNVQNPNQPTPESAATENGILLFSKGGVYINGFRGLADPKYVDGVPGYFWSGAVGLHSIMGDEVGAEAANWYMNQIGCPDAVTFDDKSTLLNPNSPKQQVTLLRNINDNANQGSNPLVHEWANMYALNNACNNILSIVEKVKFATGGDVKKKTIQAWAYWWKGFAYSRIGSMYYAGLIVDEVNATNNNFVSKEKMIEAGNANFDKAAGILAGLTAGGDYDATISAIIPSYNRTKVITPAEWVRNINTMKARNIVVNTPAAAMTPAQWTAVATLTDAGIQKGDETFTGRSDAASEFLAAAGGTVSSKVVSTGPGGGTYKLSERLVQDFKAGDKRAENNFVKAAAWIGNADRGNVFNTRYALKDGGAGMAGVEVLGSKAVGGYTLYMAGSYAENALMAAEAKINSGAIPAGTALIDAVRASQGADLAAIGTVTKAQALEELRTERRSGLAFRGLAFYDARRMGVINDLSKGGGRSGAVVVDGKGNVNTAAVINYNYLDYWDVPANELAYNAPAAGSAPVKNPR
jgi:starch-binding outer membrane protein, SusD/RagB family